MKTNLKNLLKFLICLCMCVLAGVFFAACSAIQSDYRYKGGGSSDSGSSSGGSGGSSGGGSSSDQGSSGGDVTPDVPTGDEITIRYDYGADSKLFGEFNELTLYETIKKDVGIVKLPAIKSQYSDAFLGWFDVSTDEKVKIGDKPQTDIDVYAKFDVDKLGLAGLFENGRFVKTWAKIKEENPNAFFGTAIMSNAGFSYFTNLQGELVIGNDITEIQAYAFEDCDYLTKIKISDSVTTIGEKSFFDCDSLTNLSIGEAVKTIDEQAFAGCAKLQNVYYNAINAGSDDPDGIEFSSIFLGDGIDNENGYVLTIGSSVEKIPYFFCWENEYLGLNRSKLTKVVFAENSHCTKIDSYAFSGATLTEIIIPNSVTEMGEGVFYDCISLTNVVLPSGLTGIGYDSFSGCTSLVGINIPNGVTTIGSSAFSDCANLVNVSIPDSVINFNNDVFRNCSNLQFNSFDNAYYLGNDNNPYVVLIKSKNSNISNCSIHSNTKIIYQEAFQSCYYLNGILIPNNVKTIGSSAFRYCYGLTSITIPDSVVSVGNSAFAVCGLSSVVIGKNVEYISKDMFANCGGITSITISPENTRYHSAGNCVIETATKTLVIGCKTSVIPSDGSVTIIGPSAFAEQGIFATVNSYSRLTSITIPEGIITIGSSAFSGCEGLTSITIPSSLENICGAAFKNTGLTSATFLRTDGWYYAKINGQMSHYHLDAVGIAVNNAAAIAEQLRNNQFNVNFNYFSSAGGILTTNATVNNENIPGYSTYWYWYNYYHNND